MKMKFSLTKKIQADARDAMLADFAARAIAAADDLGVGDRVDHEEIGADALRALSARGIPPSQVRGIALMIGGRAGLSARSQYAYVHYGRGGQSETKRYTGRGHHWHDYANPGARWALTPPREKPPRDKPPHDHDSAERGRNSPRAIRCRCRHGQSVD